MTREDVIEKIERVGILPVIRAPSVDLARRAVDALEEGGIPIVEVTLTVPSAISLIESLATRLSGRVIVGAGTVTTLEQAAQCVDAGAAFIVSPGLHEDMVRTMRKRSVAMLAGALTPTEIMSAVRAGADWVKVFPCSALGGPSYLRALRGPFPQVKMVPTGGVSLDTAAEFIRAGACALGLGSELVDIQAIGEGRSQVIVERSRELVRIVQAARAT